MGYALGMMCGLAMILIAAANPGHDVYGYFGVGLVIVAGLLAAVDR